MSQPTVAPLLPLQYEPIVRAALLEDLGRAGDITTDAVVPPSLAAHARLFSRAKGRLAGIDIAEHTFRLVDGAVETIGKLADGCDLEAGQTLLEVTGSARGLLTAERTVLNLLARLCGVATLTRTFVKAVSGSRARVVCTRKTTPGLRALEKYAVRCGGGANHRFGLDDAVLIKDNHLAVAGGVAPAVERARRAVGHLVKVEVEVETLEQLAEALALDVDAVLLDNMSLDTLREAVVMVGGRVITEASGGINLRTAAAVAATGVDLLSVGALTHSAPALDLSLEVELG